MATRSFTRYIEQELGKLPHFIVCAILEWFLITILFIDGILAFVANEYAKFFELRIPCLLCTRIDHVLVHRNPDFYYNDSICESHKKDVSYLAFCHNHKKLSDIRMMCEGCLLSFATEKESDCDTYKSLVGILHKDLECFVEDDTQIHLSLPAGKRDEDALEKSSVHRCSCCGEPLKVRSSNSKPSKNAAGSFAQAPAPSPRAHPFVNNRNEDSRILDSPRIRYTELKFVARNDSGITLDEDGSNINNRLREDSKAASMPLLTEPEEINDESNRTPNFIRGNRFFGIPLTDSASNSPRWTTRMYKKSPLEKQFSSDAAEVNHSSEIDSFSILSSLKRQVRLDRKSLMALYMELDEERSASAEAANNAMAMITRLQAEKAAVQMEALQYQRMMEEQAEYDQEALQATNDLLSKREEEIKALEDELEIYRDKYGFLEGFSFKGCRDEDGDNFPDFKSHSNSSQSGKSEGAGSPFSINDGDPNRHTTDKQPRSSQEEIRREILDASLEGIKEEKISVEDPLKTVERDDHSSDNGDLSSQSETDSVNRLEDETVKGSEDILTTELYRFSERVKALEAGSEFLEHASKKLENHDEGTKVLTETSDSLHKLRDLPVTNSEGKSTDN